MKQKLYKIKARSGRTIVISLIAGFILCAASQKLYAYTSGPGINPLFDVNTLGGNAETRYRHGDAPWMTHYPNCTIVKQGSSTCNKCCSSPDAILKDQFRGPGVFGDKALDDWYIEDFWPVIQTKIQQMTNQFRTAISSEATKRGTFVDAQNNMQALSGLQQANAKSALQFLPSESLCRYATLAEGLAASEANTNTVKIGMAARSFERQLLSKNVNAGRDIKGAETRGQAADKAGRWKQYAASFCNPTDNGGTLSDICSTSDDTQYNRDVDYGRTIAETPSLDIGPDTAVTKDRQNLTAFADNLYANDIVNNIPNAKALDPSNASNSDSIRKYFILRSVLAKRAIAENSFSSIAAMKSKGTPAAATYTRNLMIELGLSKEEAQSFVSDNPSYYTQMEALTRKLYESPTFYVNLMEGPDNVARQQTAMKSLELMQQRDMYKSLQRSEMLMATLVELYIARQQSGLDKQAVQSQ